MSDTAVPEADDNPQRGWFARTIKAYRSPAMVGMLLLGFASGLPLYMFFQKTSIFLRTEGIDRSTIGFFYWAGLAYSLKFVFAPFIDKVKVPVLTDQLGHRRSWMLVSIGGTILALIMMSLSDPSEGLVLIVAGAAFLAFCGATLDISIDAWRIESAPSDLQANMAAAYSFGYRGALMFSGLGLMVADIASWTAAYLLMALGMAVTAGLVLLVREPPTVTRRTLDAYRSPIQRIRGLFIEPFKQVYDRFGIVLVPILGLVFLYRFSDTTMGVMAGPLYVDLGYSTTAIGSVQALPGLIATFSGLLLGGLATQQWGVLKAMLVGAALTFLTNGAYAALAHFASGDDVAFLLGAICADNLAGGFVTTVFIAYLSSLVDPKNAATQYALFGSLYGLVAKFVAGFSGAISEALGYVNFFLLTASYAIPAGLLVLVVTVMMKRYPPRDLVPPVES